MNNEQRKAFNVLLNALRGFVDEYDTNPQTWPDDMVDLLTAGTRAILDAECLNVPIF